MLIDKYSPEFENLTRDQRIKLTAELEAYRQKRTLIEGQLEQITNEIQDLRKLKFSSPESGSSPDLDSKSIEGDEFQLDLIALDGLILDLMAKVEPFNYLLYCAKNDHPLYLKGRYAEDMQIIRSFGRYGPLLGKAMSTQYLWKIEDITFENSKLTPDVNRLEQERQNLQNRINQINADLVFSSRNKFNQKISDLKMNLEPSIISMRVNTSLDKACNPLSRTSNWNTQSQEIKSQESKVSESKAVLQEYSNPNQDNRQNLDKVFDYKDFIKGSFNR